MPSLKLSTSRSEPNSPERTSASPSSPLSSRLHSFARYNIWPRSKKQQALEPLTPLGPLPPGQQLRSQSSLSDHCSNTRQTVTKSVYNNNRNGNLALRRKVSVPELREKPSMDSFVAIKQTVDSPTIPGRPPLRSISSHMCLSQHQRSQSLSPESEFLPISKDHIASLLINPPQRQVPQPPESPILSPVSAWPLPRMTPTWSVYNSSYNPTRPLSPILSPILSPVEGTTPVPGSPVSGATFMPPPTPSKSPFLCPSPIPETPPPPPRKGPVRPFLASRPSLPILRPDVFDPSAPFSPTTTSPNIPMQFASPTSPITPRRNRSHSPTLGPSPMEEIPADVSPATLPFEQTSTAMDRGRPIGRNKSIRSVLLPSLSELSIEATLPTGLKPQEAILVLQQREKEKLAKQAIAQAERFEILPISAVNTLSKELRALDERCEYLRKTFRSLRSGRQKLHARLLSYLKSESLQFSRERLLKQEEALEELDRAIDDWATKLDLAENRRLRLRQKLLEHVAAAMMLVPGNQAHGLNQLTPPGSREGSPQNSPIKDAVNQRKEVESIKIYADTGVLNLFNEVEMAIGRMCEASF